jgi:hypothetical protein
MIRVGVIVQTATVVKNGKQSADIHVRTSLWRDSHGGFFDLLPVGWPMNGLWITLKYRQGVSTKYVEGCSVNFFQGHLTQRFSGKFTQVVSAGVSEIKSHYHLHTANDDRARSPEWRREFPSGMLCTLRLLAHCRVCISDIGKSCRR